MGLIAATGLQIARHSRASLVRLRPLKTLVPASLPGWQVRDEPIGATEGVTVTALKILDCDEVVYRSYTSGDKSFSIYIAGWDAGKRDWPDVALHTPDICWQGSGWRCLRGVSQFQLLAGDIRLEGGQWREFQEPSGGRVEVVFWHYLNGTPLEYSPYHRFSGIREALRHVGESRGVQYFVRVSSATPMDELVSLPAFQIALSKLQDL